MNATQKKLMKTRKAACRQAGHRSRPGARVRRMRRRPWFVDSPAKESAGLRPLDPDFGVEFSGLLRSLPHLLLMRRRRSHRRQA